MTSFEKFNEIYLHNGGFFNFENFEYEEYRKLYEEWYNLMYNFINENNFISNGTSKEYISQNSTELFKEFKH